jgi:uncharacterized membrane protein
MSIVHLHLILNHFPIVGAVLGVLLLGVAWLRRSDDLGKAAMGLFVLLGMLSVVVFLTGEPAEEAVEALPGISESLMERHEEAAVVATIGMSVAGVLSLVGLGLYRGRPLARWVTPAMLVVALGAAGLMGYTASLGGMIRHTEIHAVGRPDIRRVDVGRDDR